MKKLAFLITLFAFTIQLLAQQVSIFQAYDNQPGAVILKTEDSTYIYQFEEGQMPETVLFDDKYVIHPQEMFYRGAYNDQNMQIETLDSIEPGVLPEGDLPYRIKYTTDGQRIVVLCHHSNNVFFYDANTHELLEIVDVGLGPEDMVVTEQHVYISCYYSREIYIINLNDYSINTSFEVDAQPCIIKVNANETIIYIGFQVGDHKGGYIGAYDLNTFDQLFTNSWIYFEQISASGAGMGRRIYTYTKFHLVNNDQYIACLKQGSRYLMFIDALSGNIIKEFNIQSQSLATTISADTVYTIRAWPSSGLMKSYCINTNTLEIADSMIVTTGGLPCMVTWQDNFVVDGSGTKIFVELLSLDWKEIGYMADYQDHSFKYIDSIQGNEIHYYLVTSYDGRYVISIQEQLRIFDFEAEDYIYSDYWNGHWKGCHAIDASPNKYEFAWSNNGLSIISSRWMRKEMIDIFDFSDPFNVIHSDSIVCGTEPEADLTYDAILNSKHDKIVAGNPLSMNVSIIDASTYELDTLIDLERISIIENITDDLMVLTGYDCKYLYLFDVSTLSIIKQFPNTGTNIETVIPSPDQAFFYTYSRWEQQLIKYQIDGINTEKIDSLHIEDTYVYNVTWNLRYFPEISPDGMYIIFAHWPDTLNIVHTGRMDIECSIPMTDRIFDVAFSDDSKRFCVAHGACIDYFSIIYLEGPFSYLEHTIYPDGGGGYAVAYNPVDQKFYLATNCDLHVVDPETGNIDEIIYMNAQNWIYQLGIDPDGIPIVQTKNYLYYNDQEYFLREPGRQFNIDEAKQHCIIPSPGPDRIFVLDFLSTELHEISTSPRVGGVQIYPNPADDLLTVSSKAFIKEVSIFDCSGKLLQVDYPDGKQFEINTSSLKNGIYIIEVIVGKKVTRKKVVVRH